MITSIKRMSDKTIFTKEHQLLTESLKRARLDAGLDQIQVAKLLKKTQSYVSKIESGQRRIDIIQLKQAERHRLLGLDGWGIVAEIWRHTDAENPSNEEDIVRVQDDFGR